MYTHVRYFLSSQIIDTSQENIGRFFIFGDIEVDETSY